MKYEMAVEIVKTLRHAGFEAYLAGGCVRDRLLGQKPKDYDIATNALPDTIEKLFPRTVPVGKAFGVIIVLKGEEQFQVATFRSESAYSDGRHPDSVTFSDWKSDILRRDFTVNGMLYDPLHDRILDVVGGQEDLHRKIVRTIGNPLERFNEDKLRMMRAIRFACQLDFHIEPQTEKAVRQLAHQITQVSYERIREELKFILVNPQRAEGMKMLLRLGLLKEILPEVITMQGVAQPPEFHPEGDVWTHTLLCLSKLENPTFEVALATLLHDVGKPSTFRVAERIRFDGHDKVGERIAQNICERLRLSRAEIEKICWMVANHLKFKDISQMRESTLKRFLSHEHYSDLEQLFLVDKLSSDRDLSSYEFLKELRQKFSAEDLKPKPLLRGRDLIKLGLSPGPLFSKILHQLEDAQLEGKIKTQEEALAWIKDSFQEHFSPKN